MPRPGYTNLAPSAERARLFQIVADRLGMDPEEHRVRVIIVDQALAALALGLTEVEEKPMHIEVEFSSDSLWGDTDPECCS